MLIYRSTPELGTFDDEGAYVKGKCSFAVRAQLKAKTGKRNIGGGPGHGETGIFEANLSNASFMREAAEDPTKDLGPWTVRFFKDRSTGSEDEDTAFKYSGNSFKWTDLKNLTKGAWAGYGKDNFKYKCHGSPREGSLPAALLHHRMQHPVFHNEFEHSGKNIYNLLRGLAGLDIRGESGNIMALLPCGQAFQIFFEHATIGRREDCSRYLKKG